MYSISPLSLALFPMLLDLLLEHLLDLKSCLSCPLGIGHVGCHAYVSLDSRI